MKSLLFVFYLTLLCAVDTTPSNLVGAVRTQQHTYKHFSGCVDAINTDMYFNIKTGVRF